MTSNKPRDEGDPFADWDAVYVIGALSPEDRSQYEAHLLGCPRCQASVADMAGIPGLLSRVPVEQLYSEESDPPPSALLPRLLAQAARDRRRDRWRLAGAGLVAAACVLVLLIALAVNRGGSDSNVGAGPGVTTSSGSPSSGSPSSGSPSSGSPSNGSSSTTLPVLQLTPVGQNVVDGTAEIQSVTWGTRIRLQCMDRSSATPEPTVTVGTKGPAYPGWYVLYAVGRDRSKTKLATWAPVPGKTVLIEGDTRLRLHDIVRIEVESFDNKVVLTGAV